jgi:general stress protein CsbA
MKIVAIVVVVVLVAASVFADYKWRQWMATRRRDRE